MNDSQQTAAAGESCAGNTAWRQVIAILGAAVALGLVYNVASPLGVRAPKSPNQPVVRPASSNAHVSLPNTPAATKATSAPATTVALATNASASAVRWIEIKQLVEAGQIVLVDGRAKAAYEIEHIPGAVSLPAESAPAEFLAFAMKYPRETVVVVYCSSDNCDLAHELAEKLRMDLVYTNVKEMPGGVVEYRVSESKTNLSAPK